MLACFHLCTVQAELRAFLVLMHAGFALGTGSRTLSGVLARVWSVMEGGEQSGDVCMARERLKWSDNDAGT